MSDLASTWAQGVRLSLSDNAEELADSGSLDTRTPKDDEDTKSPTVNGASNSLTIDEAASSWTENSVSDAVVTNVLPQETMSVIDRGIMAVKSHFLKPAMSEVLEKFEKAEGNVVVERKRLSSWGRKLPNEGKSPMSPRAAKPQPALVPKQRTLSAPCQSNSVVPEVAKRPQVTLTRSASTAKFTKQGAEKTPSRRGTLLNFLTDLFKGKKSLTSSLDDIKESVPSNEDWIHENHFNRRLSHSKMISEVQNLLVKDIESKIIEDGLKSEMKNVLAKISEVRPITEEEISLRCYRIEEPFTLLEESFNLQLQMLLEDITIESCDDLSYRDANDMSLASSLLSLNRINSQPMVSAELSSNEHFSQRMEVFYPPTIPEMQEAEGVPLPNHQIMHHNRSQRRYPKQVRKVLQDWLRVHFENPYPTKHEKEILAREAGITVDQVTQWFTNARRRIWKPFWNSIEGSSVQSSSTRRSSMS